MIICTGIVDYSIFNGGPSNDTTIEVQVLDADGIAVATSHKQNEQMIIHNVKLWWPFGMSKKPTAYMYTLKVIVKIREDQIFIQPQKFLQSYISITSSSSP